MTRHRRNLTHTLAEDLPGSGAASSRDVCLDCCARVECTTDGDGRLVEYELDGRLHRCPRRYVQVSEADWHRLRAALSQLLGALGTVEQNNPPLLRLRAEPPRPRRLRTEAKEER